LLDAAERAGGSRTPTCLVVAQKAVSKAEGRVVRLDDVEPSPRALELADDRDPRHVEWILRESAHVVRGAAAADHRRDEGTASSAPRPGVDASNAKGEGTLIPAPTRSDASAARLREAIRERAGADVGVIVSDSFGPAVPPGTTDVALGVAGLTPLLDLRGVRDSSATSCTRPRLRSRMSSPAPPSS
jgi:coenzyme F420-0:L-glutamate ligase/coenzyme F420-1:gamma-L-glutamate ligase